MDNETFPFHKKKKVKTSIMQK